MRSVEMEAKLAPQIQAKFGENHSYCDVHTAVTPFSRVDYDHRVPGADGQSSSTMRIRAVLTSPPVV